MAWVILFGPAGGRQGWLLRPPVQPCGEVSEDLVGAMKGLAAGFRNNLNYAAGGDANTLFEVQPRQLAGSLHALVAPVGE